MKGASGDTNPIMREAGSIRRLNTGRTRRGLALALGCALALAVPSRAPGVLDAFGLRPRSYAESGRVCLLRAWDAARGRETFDLPLAAFVELEPKAASFEELAAYRFWSARLAADGRSERVRAYRVSDGTFALLGMAPLLGRTLQPSDENAAAPGVVLSYRLWQRRFAGAASVVGLRVRLDGAEHEVVGVMPKSFEFPSYGFEGELWTPLAIDRAAVIADPADAGSVVAIGRLRRGRSARGAEAELRAALRWEPEDARSLRSLQVRVIPLPELAALEARSPLGLLFADRTLGLTPALAVRAVLGE
jgi:putative ABC transport system permease protein